MILNDKIYNILKWVAIVFIPALVILIGTIGTAIGYDMTMIQTIIGAVGVFIASIIGVSTYNYNKNEEDI